MNALCLSGGGYRAVAFHTGVLWRLNELGLLNGIGRISAVSGGALLAGHLAMAWPRLEFGGDGVAKNFKEMVVAPMRNLLDVNIGTPATLLGWLPGRSGNGELTRYFAEYLYGGFALGEIAAGPDFVFCATDLRHGSLWWFDNSRMGNDETGWSDAKSVPLAAAIAASAALPILFAPARLDLRPYPSLSKGQDLSDVRYEDAILTDGGVYDDLGLDPVLEGFDKVLISDAGETLPVQKRPSSIWPCQLARVREIAMSQVRLQRLKRARAEAIGALAMELTAGEPGTKVPGFDYKVTNRLATLPTRFVPMDRRTQEDLINWGYAICAARMWETYREKTTLPYGGLS